MCAVIGAILKNPSKEDFDFLKRVFLESRIRGLHATGISFLPSSSDKILTIKEARPADEFVETHMHRDNLPSYVNDDGNLYIIGHCRYSTSDLKYNQPINNDTTSVVHNGVITQELPENWEELYGYKCSTKNDTELLLHTIEDDVSPLERWKDASISACVLKTDKTITAFRNGKRPLYLTTLPNGFIITSTADIPKRAGSMYVTIEAPMDTYITFDSELTMIMQKVNTGNKDLQNVQQK